ncbi:MAG: hypothetical protein KDJ29_21345, partial [Hyphomicrobiales bacterium]|nr:hypothetical protein [Hyphomicrobiales bacterium]
LVVSKLDLPFGCIVAPTHPLAKRSKVSFHDAAAFPIALQDNSLQIRRYLEDNFSWLFAELSG